MVATVLLVSALSHSLQKLFCRGLVGSLRILPLLNIKRQVEAKWLSKMTTSRSQKWPKTLRLSVKSVI